MKNSFELKENLYDKKEGEEQEEKKLYFIQASVFGRQT